VHLTFLTGFRNRVRALVKWIFAFVGHARGERTITLQQVSARVITMDSGLVPEALTSRPAPEEESKPRS
jgi:NADH dehydrogenase